MSNLFETLKLPDGVHGSFAITRLMLLHQEHTLEMVHALILKKEEEAGVKLLTTVVEKNNGILVTWRPMQD